MVKKYIEHEKVIEVIKNFAKGAISDGQKALDPVDDILLLCSAVDMIPAADVEEVKHGRWINNHCSVCGQTPLGEELWEHLDITPPKFEFCMDSCPCCSAKMDGKEPSNGRQ